MQYSQWKSECDLIVNGNLFSGTAMERGFSNNIHRPSFPPAICACIWARLTGFTLTKCEISMCVCVCEEHWGRGSSIKSVWYVCVRGCVKVSWLWVCWVSVEGTGVWVDSQWPGKNKACSSTGIRSVAVLPWIMLINLRPGTSFFGIRVSCSRQQMSVIDYWTSLSDPLTVTSGFWHLPSVGN